MKTREAPGGFLVQKLRMLARSDSGEREAKYPPNREYFKPPDDKPLQVESRKCWLGGDRRRTSKAGAEALGLVRKALGLVVSLACHTLLVTRRTIHFTSLSAPYRNPAPRTLRDLYFAQSCKNLGSTWRGLWIAMAGVDDDG